MDLNQVLVLKPEIKAILFLEDDHYIASLSQHHQWGLLKV